MVQLSLVLICHDKKINNDKKINKNKNAAVVNLSDFQESCALSPASRLSFKNPPSPQNTRAHTHTQTPLFDLVPQANF